MMLIIDFAAGSLDLIDSKKLFISMYIMTT